VVASSGFALAAMRVLRTFHSGNTMTQHSIPAIYMRGGTSKGVFFRADVLPPPGPERDRLLLRVLGSPDPYGKQIDGMGGASSSTSKVVVARSSRQGCDLDYCFGQVSIDAPLIDWAGNCGNLTAAVAPFAMHSGLMPIPADGMAHVRMWQTNIRKQIDSYVPIAGGQVVEDGDFVLDGVTFPAAEIRIDFLDPAGSADTPLLPTGNPIDILEVPGVGAFRATLINAGNPTVIVEAGSLGLRGDELQTDVNQHAELLARCEAIRAQGAVAMKLANSAQEATRLRPATPKLAFVTAPSRYIASNGKVVAADDIDLNARMVSMGVLHHALTGTGAIALAVAAALPGTLVHSIATAAGWGTRPLRIGHPSGKLAVAAETRQTGAEWTALKASVSRSARRLMAGQVYIP
jgi:probable AcnD-accessory protein PrpF